MAKKKPKIPNPDKLVAYDHTKGLPYLVDTVAGTLAPIPLDLPEGPDALKDPNGQYRAEVRNECKRLYMSGVALTVIHERMGVPMSTLENWTYSKHKPSDYHMSWAAERKRMLEEARSYNASLYATVEKSALDRVNEYINGAKINDPEEFSKFTAGLERLMKAVLGRAGGERPVAANPTQVNVNVTPLTPAEARAIIQNDPIRAIANASTKQEAETIIDAAVESDEQ